MEMGPTTFVSKRKGTRSVVLKRPYFPSYATAFEEVFDPTGVGDKFSGGGSAGYLAADDLSFENMKTLSYVCSRMVSFLR
jgi:sugar/nucleoside kinase (ribokinase family)